MVVYLQNKHLMYTDVQVVCTLLRITGLWFEYNIKNKIAKFFNKKHSNGKRCFRPRAIAAAG
jgi:hypothetical protein